MVPYEEFLLLVSNYIQTLNTKKGPYQNIFKRIFLFGNENPDNIYKNIKDNVFKDKIKCFELENLKNETNLETIFKLENLN